MLTGIGNRGWETVVFWAASALALMHALDDPFLSRQPAFHRYLGVAIGECLG